MADWATFIGVVGIILVLLLALTRASATLFDESTLSTDDETALSGEGGSALSGEESADSVEESADSVEKSMPMGNGADSEIESVTGASFDTETVEPVDADAADGPAEGPIEPTGKPTTQPTGKPTAPSLSTPALLANVAVSQGLFAVLLVVMAWYTQIPAWAFGLSGEQLSLGAVGTGIVVGGVLYGLNEAAAVVGRRQGISPPTALREALAPDSAAGWATLLLVVLPIIAGFEELLFRGALIGVVHAGFGLPLWLVAIGSSVAFALGHNAQGRLGIVITGLLGLGLAAVFIYTGSLLVVIVAHYVVNAAEFVVHEGLDLG